MQTFLFIIKFRSFREWMKENPIDLAEEKTQILTEHEIAQ